MLGQCGQMTLVTIGVALRGTSDSSRDGSGVPIGTPDPEAKSVSLRHDTSRTLHLRWVSLNDSLAA